MGLTLRLVEPFAGFAAVTLRALLAVDPPVSRIGSKAGYARHILHLLVPPGERVESALLVDADPRVVNLWRHVGELAPAIEPYLDGDARDAWQRARERIDEVGVAGAAAFVVWTCGARGGIGGFKGAHKLRPSVDGFIPSRRALHGRLVCFGRIWPADRVEVRLGSADEVAFGPDDLAYLDPPYPGTQGYAGKASAEVVRRTWANASSARRRALSGDSPEAYEGIRAPSWRLVRRGQRRRSLTRVDDEWLLLD